MPAPNRLREALFRETPLARAERVLLGIARALTPKRMRYVPGLTWLWLKDVIRRDGALPDPETAGNVGGIVGFAHDLSVLSVVAAARRGLYPLGHVGRPKWWSPKTRAIVAPDDFHISKSLRRLMRRGRYTVTFDQAFERVIKACAARRKGRLRVNWITPAMMHAYADLFDAGYAHSMEVWNADGELVGGGYGIAIGNTYIGESLFSRERDVSKIATATLAWHLSKWGFAFMDSKHVNALMASMGFHPIPRADFLKQLSEAVDGPGKPGRWRVEAALEVVAEWRPAQGRADAAKASVKDEA